MKFLDTGNKIKILRKKLDIKQEELNSVGVSRNFISMIENGKKKLPYPLASKLVNIFKSKADELNLELTIDEEWLMISAKQQAIDYCNNKLGSALDPCEIDTLADLVNEYNIKEYLPEIFMLKADQLYDSRCYEEAFTYYYEILEHISNDISQKSFIYNKLGKCKIKMLNYFEAITYFGRCYLFSQSSNEIINKRNCLYNMALCYRKLGNNNLALESINEFISLCDVNECFNEYMSAVILKANCFADMKNYSEAIQLITQSISSFSNDAHELLGYFYNTLGTIYLDTNNLSKALAYLEKAYKIRELSDKYNLPITLMNIAEIYINQNELSKATEVINQAITISESHSNDYNRLKSYAMLEKIYIAKNKNEMLIELYITIIDLQIKNNNKYESLKFYIKLLKLLSDTGDLNRYKEQLDKAITLCDI